MFYDILHCKNNFEVVNFQELSPTTNTNLAVSLMRLMEAQMEEFKDPAAIKAMDPREVVAWIEVRFYYLIRISGGHVVLTNIRKKIF